MLYFLAILINSQYGYSMEKNRDDYIVKHLRHEFKNLGNTVLQSEDSIINFTSDKIHNEFKQQIENKTNPLKIRLFLNKDDIDSVFPYPPTYSKIFGLFYMPKGVSASKSYIYNASKIPITTGYCVAAEGPNHETFENFIALLGEIEARVSISLVSEDEFLAVRNKRISSLLAINQEEYFINEIKSEVDPNVTIRDSYNIKLIDYYTYDEAFLEYELFLINGKYHLRVYHTNWLDGSDTSLNKLIQIIVFMKEIKKLDAFKDSKYSPAVVVNCNAGVGRAGTFISIWNLIDNYLNNQQIPDVAEFIVNARNYRSYFVYNSKQYGMIKYLSQNLSKYLDK
jgi:protein tyrosine phosphatase